MQKLRIVATAGLLLALVAAPTAVAQAPDNPGRDTGSDRAAEARESAQERRERAQAEAEERRAEVQQDVCEQRQDQLEDAVDRMGTASTTLLGVMDDTYERVQGFYEDTPLTAEDYEELAEAVDSEQAHAEDAVGAVEGYEFELDCDEPGVGQQLDSFRQLVTEAREQLMGYREALVDLISSLRAEAAEEQQDNDNDEAGGNDA